MILEDLKMVSTPIMIKLKPIQTKKLVATGSQPKLELEESQPVLSGPIVIESRPESEQPINNGQLNAYDSRIAERTPIEELKAGKHQLPLWADGLFDITPIGQPRRRRKLTHLTPNEKILRRKLKNRVAAQNARDKKKNEAEGLKTENEQLRALVEQLREDKALQQYEYETLRNENAVLRERLGLKKVVSSSNCVVLQEVTSPKTPTEVDNTDSGNVAEVQVKTNSGSSPDVRVGSLGVKQETGSQVTPLVALQIGRI